MKSCWVVGALALCAVSVSAQVPAAKMAIATDDDYSQAMKEVAAQNGVLRKTLPSSPDAAAAAAVRLETVFKDIQAYWENRKVEKCHDRRQDCRRGVKGDLTGFGRARHCRRDGRVSATCGDVHGVSCRAQGAADL